MRDIKFRAWHKNEEVMLSVNCIDWESSLEDDDRKGFIGHNEGIAYSVESIGGHDRYEENFASPLADVILMQFTGLRDKNGKEIYEGDILLGRFNIDEVCDHIFVNLSEHEVETQSKIFYVEDIFYLYMQPTPDDIEIIGNAHENPELLEN